MLFRELLATVEFLVVQPQAIPPWTFEMLWKAVDVDDKELSPFALKAVWGSSEGLQQEEV